MNFAPERQLINVDTKSNLATATNLPLNDWLLDMEPDAKNPKLARGRNLEKLGKDFGVNTVSILQSLFRLGKDQIVCCTRSVYHLV